MKKVKFTRDFGIKRADDVCEYDGQLCRQLVNIDKVAEYTDDDITLVDESREYLEVPSEVAHSPSKKLGESNDETAEIEDLDEENNDGDGMLLSNQDEQKPAEENQNDDLKIEDSKKQAEQEKPADKPAEAPKAPKADKKK